MEREFQQLGERPSVILSWKLKSKNFQIKKNLKRILPPPAILP